MAYVCELSTGRTLYLDNANGQTTVSIASTAPGQQQQATSRFQTGAWTATPEVYLTRDGAVVKLQAEMGAHYIRVQGGSIGVSEATSLEALEQIQMQQVTGMPMSAPEMQPMQPIQPMQPMTMGNMQMNMNPMEMRMGNMELRMGNAPSTPAQSTAQRFCSQCGTAVKSEDRFCTNCGHRLGE
jgi:NADH pyrophosphatase NudC (nudix superfamily)